MIKGIESHHKFRAAKTDDGVAIGMDQGFLLTLENGVRIYHSGDTCSFLDLRHIGELYRPNIMMLETGARETSPPVTNPFEAATIVRWIGPDVFIPIHSTQAIHDKTAELLGIAAPHIRVIVMNPGETITYRPFQVEKK